MTTPVQTPPPTVAQVAGAIIPLAARAATFLPAGYQTRICAVLAMLAGAGAIASGALHGYEAGTLSSPDVAEGVGAFMLLAGGGLGGLARKGEAALARLDEIHAKLAVLVPSTPPAPPAS